MLEKTTEGTVGDSCNSFPLKWGLCLQVYKTVMWKPELIFFFFFFSQYLWFIYRIFVHEWYSPSMLFLRFSSQQTLLFWKDKIIHNQRGRKYSGNTLQLRSRKTFLGPLCNHCMHRIDETGAYYLLLLLSVAVDMEKIRLKNFWPLSPDVTDYIPLVKLVIWLVSYCEVV